MSRPDLHTMLVTLAADLKNTVKQLDAWREDRDEIIRLKEQMKTVFNDIEEIKEAMEKAANRWWQLLFAVITSSGIVAAGVSALARFWGTS